MYLVAVLDILSAKLQTEGNEINSTEYGGFFRAFLNVYKVGSRRINQLKNVSANGAYKSKRTKGDEEDSDIEYVPIKRIKGYSFSVTYQREDIQRSTLIESTSIVEPPSANKPVPENFKQDAHYSADASKIPPRHSTTYYPQEYRVEGNYSINHLPDQQFQNIPNAENWKNIDLNVALE